MTGADTERFSIQPSFLGRPVTLSCLLVPGIWADALCAAGHLSARGGREEVVCVIGYYPPPNKYAATAADIVSVAPISRLSIIQRLMDKVIATIVCKALRPVLERFTVNAVRGSTRAQPTPP